MNLAAAFGEALRPSLSVDLSSNQLVNEPPLSREAIDVVVAQTSAHRVDMVRRLNVKSGARNTFVFTHMQRVSAGHGLTEAQTRVDAYVACVHLQAFDDFDMWCDDRKQLPCRLGQGALHINDMRHEWRADIRKPFSVLNFYIPQMTLEELFDEDDLPRINELRCPISDANIDPVLHNMALALLPALARPEQTDRLFADHAARAITAHLLRTYGLSSSQPVCGRGRLAPWQEKRAKELLRADLSGNIGVSEIASACRLSPSHFSLAFRETVGCAPHQWLINQRVDLAKQMILNTKKRLSEIALATGFADQSHFTRVFSQRVKVSPAAWRRAQGRLFR